MAVNWDRFWSKVNKTDYCWNWRAGKSSTGYGYFNVDATMKSVHRLSYLFAHGEIPDGTWVLHKCDNPPCVNPNHLFLGDVKINHTDMVTKGRSTFGEKNPNAILTRRTVKVMREYYIKYKPKYKDLGGMFNVHKCTAWDVINSKTWLT